MKQCCGSYRSINDVSILHYIKVPGIEPYLLKVLGIEPCLSKVPGIEPYLFKVPGIEPCLSKVPYRTLSVYFITMFWSEV